MEKIYRPEHPQPQFERKNWLCLNGEWDFEIDYTVSGRERKFYKKDDFSGKIIVPFCPESILSGVRIKDFMPCVWYRKIITIPDRWQGGKVFLHFGAVDYKAFVYINGVLAGTHKGGYSSFKFDITPFLDGKEAVVTVCAEDDTRSFLQPTGKQSLGFYSSGCEYTRTTGIWQTVWLEHVPDVYIESVKYYPDSINGSLLVTADLIGEGEFGIRAYYENQLMGESCVKSRGGNAYLNIPLKEVHLWEVGNGRLYDLELSYDNDKVKSYFGLRNVRLDGMKFLVNEKSVFQRLVLDQGFYPSGIYTAPSEEDLIRDIQLSLDAGFNGARLHERVFEPRFLYHADRMGYIVWGEHASWGLNYSNPEIVELFLREWTETLNRDFNHPSIIGWCPLNEAWDRYGKQLDSTLAIIYDMTKQIDPTRPCIDSSGGLHVKTDIFDKHDYDQNPETFKERYDLLITENKLLILAPERQTYRGEPCFISEYGGIKWTVGESEGWGYGEGPNTLEEFIARYRGLTDALLDNGKIFGFCYTQLYDIEQEVNGIYTYDRNPKFDVGIIKEINTRKAAIEE